MVHRPRPRFGALAYILVAMACSQATSQSSSTSTQWLVCQVDGDCTSLADAVRCGSGGYCVDAAERRVSVEDRARGVPGADGGTCTGPACSVCPAPSETNFTCPKTTHWARDVATGTCCPYEDVCVAPRSWPLFESESECQTDCRCRDIEVQDVLGVDRTSLECSCASYGCPESIEAATLQMCGGAFASPNASRSEGCGMILLTNNGGISGNSWVFDQMTRALIGTSWFTDIPEPPCQTGASVAGAEFVCSEMQTCQLCGTPFDPSIQPCQ